MPLTPHSLGNTEAYWAELCSHFKKLERFECYVYTDKFGVPTFGIGYALVIKVGKKWTVRSRSDINDRLLSIGRSIDEDDMDTLQEVAKELNQGRIARAKSLVLEHFFNCDGITESEGDILLRNVIENEYSNGLKNRIGTAIYNSLLNTKELIALQSIYYQNPSAIKKPLIDALSATNRAEAWFQIRYAMNTANKAWLANRRYQEADEFGLYNDGVININDAKEVMRMFTIHQLLEKIPSGKLANYESRFPTSITKTDSINLQIKKAKDYLISSYAFGTIDGEIIIGAGLDTYAYKEKTRINDNLIGSDKGDLIFGEKGNDTIHGGLGNDEIYGGLGSDYLYGDDGTDILVSRHVSNVG